MSFAQMWRQAVSRRAQRRLAVAGWRLRAEAASHWAAVVAQRSAAPERHWAAEPAARAPPVASRSAPPAHRRSVVSIVQARSAARLPWVRPPSARRALQPGPRTRHHALMLKGAGRRRHRVDTLIEPAFGGGPEPLAPERRERHRCNRKKLIASDAGGAGKGRDRDGGASPQRHSRRLAALAGAAGPHRDRDA